MHVRVSQSTRNGKTYRYIQIVQSYRREKDGMPAHRVIASLGDLPEPEVANLKAALEASRKGKRVVVDRRAAERLPAQPVQANLRFLDIVVCLELWKRWGLSDILGQLFANEATDVATADVLVALTLQRCVEPGSKLAGQRWFPRTALPEVLSLAPSRFNNTRVHRALSALESVDAELQAALSRRYPAQDGPYTALFLDITDTWFVGHGPDLARYGKTKEGMVRRKVGIVLLCDQRGYPVRWTVIDGKRPDGKATLDMIAQLANLNWALGTPLVVDRAMGKACYVEALLRSDLHFLTAIPVSEFETYTDTVPHQALATVDVSNDDGDDAQTFAAAADAVGRTGMQAVSDRLLVLDLGLLYPFGSTDGESTDSPTPPTHVEAAAMSAAAELRFGRRMKADFDAGRARSIRALGRRYGCGSKLASSLVKLTELNSQVQQVVLAGRAEQVSRRGLLRLRELPNADQLDALEAAITEAAQPHTHFRRRKAAGGKTPRTRHSFAVGAPVRGVLYFNPKMFVEKRRTSLRRLAAIEEAVEDLNRRLASPHSKRTEQSILGEVGRLLSGHELLSVYEPILTTYQLHGRSRYRVELRFDEEVWQKRRRFDGFALLVGHGELRQTPEELVQLYRAKDQVEKDFQLIKSELEIRPVWHRTDQKLKAHTTLCMLALLLERTLEQRLASAGVNLTAKRVLEELATCNLNQLELPDCPEPIYTTTRITDEQARILDALDMAHLADDQEIAASIEPR